MQKKKKAQTQTKVHMVNNVDSASGHHFGCDKEFIHNIQEG